MPFLLKAPSVSFGAPVAAPHLCGTGRELHILVPTLGCWQAAHWGLVASCHSELLTRPQRELVSAPDTGEVGSLCWERFLALRFDDSSFLGCFPSAELGVPASVWDGGKLWRRQSWCQQKPSAASTCFPHGASYPAGPCVCNRASSCFLDRGASKTCGGGADCCAKDTGVLTTACFY